jgi:two-component system NarL family response regulator
MENFKSIRVLVADDHFVVRIGLSALIATQKDMSVVGEAGDGLEAVQLYRSLKPDIVILDLRMPAMNGISATSAIIRDDPDAKIMVLSTYDGDVDIHNALRAGALGYLLKGAPSEELVQAIRTVNSGRRYIPASVATRLAEYIYGLDLTARELEVLTLIVKGRSNKDIAITLSISEATVKTHINNIFSKLGVNDRTQAATMALQRGIVHVD